MRCCFEDCPSFSDDASESDVCSACGKEYALMYLSDAVEDVDRALEAVDWRFCLASLEESDSANQDLRQVKDLFQQLELVRDRLKERFIVTSV